ncbi:Glutamate receptor ionotropic, NMDA 1-like 6, partial [Homarus americanus]
IGSLRTYVSLEGASHRLPQTTTGTHIDLTETWETEEASPVSLHVSYRMSRDGKCLKIAANFRTYYTDFSEPLFMDDFVVTYKRPVLEADLQGFIKPFTPLLWVLVLVSVVVTFAFTWGVFKASHLLHYTRVEGEGTGVTEERKGGDLIYTAEKSILWTYSLLVGQSVPWEPQRAWVRVLPGFWLLTTLILGSVYRSNLKAMLIMPKVRLPFNTIQELEATGISLCVPEGNAVHQAIMEADVTSKLGSLKKQLIVPVDMVKAAKDSKEGDFACSTPLFIVMFYLNLYKLTDGECILYIMSERILGARSMVFMMPKGSPLKTRVDRVCHVGRPHFLPGADHWSTMRRRTSGDMMMMKKRKGAYSLKFINRCLPGVLEEMSELCDIDVDFETPLKVIGINLVVVLFSAIVCMAKIFEDVSQIIYFEPLICNIFLLVLLCETSSSLMDKYDDLLLVLRKKIRHHMRFQTRGEYEHLLLMRKLLLESPPEVMTFGGYRTNRSLLVTTLGFVVSYALLVDQIANRRSESDKGYFDQLLLTVKNLT